MRHDVPRHRCRHEIIDRKGGGEPRPNLGRRDVARPSRHEKDAGFTVLRARFSRCPDPRAKLRRARRRLVERHPGTGHHNEMRRVQDLGKLPPRGNFCKGVGAEDEEDLPGTPPVAVQRAKRVDRVRRARPGKFDVGNAPRRPLGDGQRRQRKAMERACARIDRPVRRVVRGDEPHFIEFQR
jgi:hypothetical protein